MPENKKEEKAIEVESSKSIVEGVKKTMDVVGLEEIPTSIIPLPFYRLVQPGSTGTAMADGKDAPVGEFLMSDLGQSVEEIKFLMLRAKRQHREFVNEYGRPQKTTKIAILGLNTERMTPFVLNVSVSSFSNFGKMMAQVKEKGLKHAWDHAVTATTEKREEEKDTPKGRQKVKYWVINFDLADKPVDKGTLETAEAAYSEYAASLDWKAEQDTEEEAVVGPAEVKEEAAVKADEIPF